MRPELRLLRGSAAAPAEPAVVPNLMSPGPAEAPARRGRTAGRIAVAIHGIEPATFERCAVIRDWLDDHGIDRVRCW